ncbi:MAG: (2Fe-2S)-binding protein [Gammaproteobacteria bacterium]
MSFTIKVNGADHILDADGDTPLLWVLRDELRLTGTKFGCGISACGACTVLVDGVAIRSCTFPLDAAEGTDIVSIEGLSDIGMTSLQDAWVEEDVPQCGYCQSGQIMAAAALLNDIEQPSEADIDATMTNICRCGTYSRIKKAIQRVVADR